ncbi:hypothetical protein GIB67_003972 [Kingdonia uniflora]|uniref:Uncharacterized protein n=1 Tax=Kingdonia uniflora TaxID=39325 RepID=A0A7J7NRL8_9MAGN|nr:hypothetical protein GIB67_003972 [Kingdonia uniflora]
MSATTSTTRDARRRRIVERGSDRLALITGKIQSLPQSQRSHHSHTVSSPSLLLNDQHLASFNSDPQTKVTLVGEDDASNIALQKHETGIDTRSIEPQLRKCETRTDIIRPSSPDTSSKAQPSPFLSELQNVPNSTVSQLPLGRRAESPHHYPNIFTASQISSSISASENIRILCSITIALLVVLSHFSIPNGIKRIITYRPVHLVLLTDITLVLARLLLWKQVARRAVSEDASGWADGLGKALETGLVFYKAISAAFMDCSIYAVVVICGLSLVGNWLY